MRAGGEQRARKVHASARLRPWGSTAGAIQTGRAARWRRISGKIQKTSFSALWEHVCPRMSDPIRDSLVLEASLKGLILFVEAQGRGCAQIVGNPEVVPLRRPITRTASAIGYHPSS